MSKNAHNPPVKLIHEMHPKLKGQLVTMGMWRCHVLSPDCHEPPYAEVLYIPKQKVRGVFCKRHTRNYCNRNGYVFPESLSN